MAIHKNIDKISNAETTVNQSGPFQAKIVGHVDETYMGSLRVQLLKKTSSGNKETGTEGQAPSSQVFTARYLSPFGGSTPRDTIKNNPGYRGSQQSYGMWMVPPDIGTIVLVIFVEGNPNDCYWIGCVQDKFANFSVPGHAATTFVDLQDEDNSFNDKFKGKKLPVAEYNKLREKGLTDPTKFTKPYQKRFTEDLEKQGLLEDETRGITSSSARRELPSTVFGISTPGPTDKTEKASRGVSNSYRSRLGGTSFVMDDGDVSFLRKGSATTTPPEYANVMQNDTDGDKTLPHNELVRLKTRTGHQILLHNTEDLIYIANANGSAWIELTADGKIDIYAKDSMSVHTENDLNLTAGRDITMEAGANISLKASGTYIKTDAEKTTKGRIQIESAADTNMLIGGNHWVTTVGNYEARTTKETRITSGGQSHIKSGGNHIETAPQIHMNGPAASAAQIVTALNTHILPGTPTGNLNGTLVQRAPTHEPWTHHENLNPVAFKIPLTDRDKDTTTDNKLITPSTPEAFKKVSTVKNSN